jgi:type III pantothenate kinase
MKLLVDIGNSRVKWAFVVHGQFVSQGEEVGNDAASLAPLVDSRHVPEEIRIANVAGIEAGQRAAKILHRRFDVAPLVAVSAAAGGGVRSGYRDPRQLGVDRWLALCAAYVRCQAPVCVVDAGTATTLDLVSRGGLHQGGLILPGITLMQQALLRGTGDLARLAGSPNTQADRANPAPGLPDDQLVGTVAMGRDTAAAIRFGALQATASLVRQCLDVLQAGDSGGAGPAMLVLTGGAAPAVKEALAQIDRARPSGWYRVEHRQHLVLEGLALEPPCFTIATQALQ